MLAPVVKQQLERLLIRLRLYAKLKWSPLHQLFIRFNNPDFLRRHRDLVDWHRPYLQPDALVFDIGANRGDRSAAYLALGCKVIAAEPDPKSQAELQNRFRRSTKFRLTKHAVSDKPGVATFFSFEPGSGYNTLSEKRVEELMDKGQEKTPEAYDVHVTTLGQMIAEYGTPQYVKIDAEGLEREIIAGLNMAPSLISFEANLNRFREPTLDCVEMLSKLDQTYRFNCNQEDAGPLLHPHWLDPATFSSYLREADLPYLEVFASLSIPPTAHHAGTRHQPRM